MPLLLGNLHLAGKVDEDASMLFPAKIGVIAELRQDHVCRQAQQLIEVESTQACRRLMNQGDNSILQGAVP